MELSNDESAYLIFLEEVGKARKTRHVQFCMARDLRDKISKFRQLTGSFMYPLQHTLQFGMFIKVKVLCESVAVSIRFYHQPRGSYPLTT